MLIANSPASRVAGRFRPALLSCAIAGALLLAAQSAVASDAPVAQPDVDGGDRKVTELQGVQVKAAVVAPAQVGSKTAAPLIETPQSISVIDQQELTVRAVQNLSDALVYTAGVSTNATGTDERYDWPMIRGFSAGAFGIYLDGLRFVPGQFAGRIEPYLLQSVSVLKGPSSVLYGQDTPGGVIDASSKLPTAEPLHELGVQLGNQDFRQLQADFSGPLDQAGHWLYRLTAVAHDDDTQIDHGYDKRVAIAPAITWRPDEDTSLTLLANFQRDLTNSLYPFLPAQGSVLYNPNGRLSPSLFTGDTDFDSYKRSQYGLGYQFKHRIDEVWSFELDGRVERQQVDWRQQYGTGTLAPDYRTMQRIAFHDQSWVNSYTFDNRAIAHFETGPFTHTVLLGLDASYFTGLSNEYGNLAHPLDVFNPVYGQPVPPLSVHSSDTAETLRQTGVYAQDQIKYGDHWVGMFDVRRDWASTRADYLLGGGITHQSDSKTTGRAGLVYLTDFGLAPYVSWSTSFLPNSGTDYLGRPFQPSLGRQIEGGLKYQPHDIDATLTLSVFDIHETNVLETDPQHPNFSMAAGEVRSRGAELEGVAHLTDGLQLRAAYTYDQVRTLRSTDPTQLDKPPTTVPMHMASVWADYTVQGGPAHGLGFGAGVRRVGETYGGTYHPDLAVAALTRDFNVPAFTLVDAVVHYQWDQVRLALNANNLFDRHYVAACYGELGCTWGQRRVVMGTASWRW